MKYATDKIKECSLRFSDLAVAYKVRMHLIKCNIQLTNLRNVRCVSDLGSCLCVNVIFKCMNVI